MATTINNTASTSYSVGGTPSTATSNTISVTYENTSNISVTKTANPTTFAVGDIITYTVVITNTGSNFITGVRIVDNLGGGNTAYVLDSANLSTLSTSYPITPIATNPLTFTLQELNAGQSMTLTYNCQVVFNLPANVNTIINTVQATGYTYSNSYSAFANATITRSTTTPFSITKGSTLSVVYPNQTFSYIITLTNNNTTVASVANITDTLPSNFTLQGASLKIGSGADTPLDSTDYTLDSTTNTITVPSTTGPTITVPASGTTILTLTGYLS